MRGGGVGKHSMGADLVRKTVCMIPALFCLAFCIVVVPLQMILPTLPGVAAKPDLPAMLIAYAAFRLPLIPSFGLAAAVGFWRDLLTAGHVGPSLVAFTLAAILVFLLREIFFLRSLWIFPALAALAAFVILGISHTVRLLELRQWTWSSGAWGEFAISSVLTAAAGLPTGFLFDWSAKLLLPGPTAEKEDDLLEIELL